MKKLHLITIAVVALLLCACGGKQQPYTYVEPEENIAAQIWNLLTQENTEVQPVIAAAIDIDYYTQEECIASKSNTELEYDYFIPQGFAEDDNFLAANYLLKCYQKRDNSWIALVLKDVHGYGIDEKDCGQELFSVHYDGEKTTPCELETVCTDFTQFAKANLKDPVTDKIIFENTAFTLSSSYFWPIRYNWNGKVFIQDPESTWLISSVDLYHGDFYFFDKGDRQGINIGEHHDAIDSMKGDDYTDSKGNVLAHFEFTDGIVEGYTLESPLCGVAQAVEHVTEYYIPMITSKPVALGYPIQNVLDYDRGYWMKDTVVSQGTTDGKYVITQQISHDKLFKKRDVFIEYTAKDEHSNIEKIHVYSYPILVLLEDEVNDSEDLAEPVKAIFNQLDYDFQSSEFGEFDFFVADSYNKNGFDARFNGEVKAIRFQTYDAGGKTLVVLAEYGGDEVVINSDKLLNLQAWYYENGQFTPTTLDLPKPSPEDFEAYTLNGDTTIDPEHYSLSFNDLGIEYYAFSDRNDGTAMRDEDGLYINPDSYTVQYPWNGKKFE